MTAADLARLVSLGALWGGSFAFMRVAVAGLGPLWLAETRVTLAFLALYAFARMRRGVPAFLAHWREYAIIGLVNTALPFALFAWATQHAPASVAAILNATSPFFGAIVAAIWLRERITPIKLAGMAVGFSGVVLLVGWQSQQLDGDALLAVGACLAASLCYGIASVYARTKLEGLSSFSIALYSQMTAAAMLALALPFAPLPISISPLVVGNVTALALASTAVAYLLYFRLIADLGPARALTVTFLIPLFGVLWGWLFLGERVGIDTLGACALILCGTWLAVRQPARRSVPIPVDWAAFRPARRQDPGSALEARGSAAASGDRHRDT